jgi:hypothetical protein
MQVMTEIDVKIALAGRLHVVARHHWYDHSGHHISERMAQRTAQW